MTIKNFIGHSNREVNIQHYGQDNWIDLVNSSSYTDDEGVAHTVLGVWEQFVGDTIKVYSGYSNNWGYPIYRFIGGSSRLWQINLDLI